MSGEVFVLPAVLGIEQAGALKQDLLTLAALADPVEIDGSAVQQATTAPLQLLAAFARERHARAAPLQWRSVSPSLHSAAATLGIAAALGIKDSA
jgi:hypothetical protein